MYKFILLGLMGLIFLNASCEKTKDSSQIIQEASKAIHENRKEDAIKLLKSVKRDDKSYQFAQEILYGLTDGKEGSRPTTEVVDVTPTGLKTDQSLPDYIKEVVAYKEGPDGLVIYFILAASSGKEMTASGTAELNITGYCSYSGTPYSAGELRLEKYFSSIKDTDFSNTEVGIGAFKRPALLYSFGRIKLKDMLYFSNRNKGAEPYSDMLMTTIKIDRFSVSVAFHPNNSKTVLKNITDLMWQ